MKYVCLLRGINVGGNNKVAMSDLRSLFVDLGYKNVSTYINSGNVIFESDEINPSELINQIEQALKAKILPLRVTVVSQDQLATDIEKAPTDWGKDTTRKHNLLFVRPPVTADEVIRQIGQTRDEYETVTKGQNVVYWSASLKDFGKTASSKLAGKPIYQDVTVRNYNTSVKLLELMQGD